MPYADVAAVIGGTADAARRSAADGIATLRKTYAARGHSRRRGPMITNHEPEARDLLETLPGVTDAQLRTLHDRLAASAAAEGVLDVAYRTLDTPAGTLLLAATGQGLVRVAWAVRGP